MKHNKRCADANPKSKCRCRCGGGLHGITHEKENDKNQFERTITKSIGGELGKKIESLEGKEFICKFCNSKETIGNWLGYPHESGLADKHGKKWWIYIECNCGHHWSLDKIESLMKYKQHTVDEYTRDE